MDNRVFEDACVNRVVVLSGVRPAGRTVDQREGRPLHGILYIRSGAVTFAWNGRTLTVGRGGLMYIPKHQCYKMQYIENETGFVLVNLDLFDKDRGELFLAEEPSLLAEDLPNGRIDRIMISLEVCGAAQGLAAALRRKELVFRLLGAICDADAAMVTDVRSLGTIREGARLLEETYLENLPISHFAAKSNVSLSSFRSLFKKYYGTSPVQYRNRLRIERARELLREGGCTVSEAAYACGFENIGYFCRYYKRITGETPGDSRAPRDAGEG